jgi:hypothetical protein
VGIKSCVNTCTPFCEFLFLGGFLNSIVCNM